MLLEFDKNNPVTPIFLFLAAAVNRKTKKPEQFYIYSDGNRMIATDGHQLHITTRLENQLPVGFYEIIKLSKTAVSLQFQAPLVKFPDVSRVLPKDPKPIDFKTIGPLARYAEMVRNTTGLPVPYTKFEAVENLISLRSYSQAGEYDPVLLEGDEDLALIMPLKP